MRERMKMQGLLIQFLFTLLSLRRVLRFWRRAATSPAVAFEFPGDAPSQTKASEPFAFPAQAQQLKKCSPSGPVSFSDPFAKPELQAEKMNAKLNTYRVRFDSNIVLARLDSLFGLSSGAFSLYGYASGANSLSGCYSGSRSDYRSRSFDCSCDSSSGFGLVLPLFKKKMISQLKQR
jgi:hypothetical protein